MHYGVIFTRKWIRLCGLSKYRKIGNKYLCHLALNYCFCIHTHTWSSDPQLDPPPCYNVKISHYAETYVNISWIAPRSTSALGNVSGFILEVRELSRDGETVAFVHKPEKCEGNISYVATLLKPATDYDVSVAAIIKSNFGTYSQPVEFSTVGGKQVPAYCNLGAIKLIKKCKPYFVHSPSPKNFDHFITLHCK